MGIVPSSYCPSFECSGGYAYAVCNGGFFGECNCGGTCVLIDGGACDFPDVAAPMSPEAAPDKGGPVEEATTPGMDASIDTGFDVFDFEDADDAG